MKLTNSLKKYGDRAFLFLSVLGVLSLTNCKKEVEANRLTLELIFQDSTSLKIQLSDTYNKAESPYEAHISVVSEDSVIKESFEVNGKETYTNSNFANIQNQRLFWETKIVKPFIDENGQETWIEDISNTEEQFISVNGEFNGNLSALNGLQKDIKFVYDILK